MLSPDRLLNVLSVLEKRKLQVRPRQCTRLRHRRSACTRCSDVCPTKAITWSTTTLEIDQDKCTSCGLCATLCPTGAIEARDPSNVELVARARDLGAESPAVAFACPTYLKTRSGKGGTCVKVDCLGRLDESVLVGAVAWGGKDLLLVDGACGDCALRKGRALADWAASKAKTLLSGFGSQPGISFVRDLPAEMDSQPGEATSASEISRRGFFNLMMGRAKQAGAVTIGTALDIPEARSPEEQVKPGELPVFVPAKRQLLLAALRRLEVTPAAPSDSASYWVRFDFTSACTGCRMCALFCPTGALSKIGPDDRSGVGFQSALCTDCRLCQELCHWKAVTMATETDLSRIVAGALATLPMPFAKGPSGL